MNKSIRLLYINVNKEDSMAILNKLINQGFHISLIHIASDLHEAKGFQYEYNYNLVFINDEDLNGDVFSYIRMFPRSIVWKLIVNDPTYSYMRKAIKSGVNDVIIYNMLSRENYADLHKIFSDAKIEDTPASEKLGILLSNIKDNQEVDEWKLKRTLEQNELFIGPEKYYIAIARLDDISYWYRILSVDRKQLADEFLRLIKKSIDKNIKIILTKKHSVTLFFSNEEFTLEEVEKKLKKLQEEFVHDVYTISIGYSKNPTDLNEFMRNYKKLIKIQEYKFYLGNNSLINEDNFIATRRLTNTKYQYNILNWINRGNFNNAMFFNRQFLTHVKKNKISKEDAKNFYYELIDLKFYNPSNEIMANYIPTLYKLLIRSADTYLRLTINSKVIIRILIEFNKQLNLYKNNEYIIKAKEYINENIEREINLENISLYLNISTSYFSRIFKQKSGLSFIQYVNKQKIEYAKGLLVDNSLSINDIANRLSYSNQFYFSRVFKNYVGKTPSQYRALNKPIGDKNNG